MFIYINYKNKIRHNNIEFSKLLAKTMSIYFRKSEAYIYFTDINI